MASGRVLAPAVARETSQSVRVSSVEALTTCEPPMKRTYDTALLCPLITESGTCRDHTGLRVKGKGLTLKGLFQGNRISEGTAGRDHTGFRV